MTVEVRLIGHLGNNLFEYALGRIIAESLDRELIVLPGKDIPGWNDVERLSGIVDRLQHHFKYFDDVPLRIPGEKIERPQIRYVQGENRWQGQAINLQYIMDCGENHRIILKGYFQRTEYYYPYKEKIKRWFGIKSMPLPVELDSTDVVVHIRRSPDMFVLNRTLDLSYYTNLLSGMEFGRVFVLGLGIDEQVKKALEPFSPIYLDMEAMPSLYLISKANRIILANSTFSWWGAFLSEAQEIYFPRPVRGVWSPECPEIALEVPETRYQIVDQVAVQNWRPHKMISPIKTNLQQNKEGETVLNIRFAHEKDSINVPSQMSDIVERISTFDRPFGLLDFADLELSARRRANLVELLFVLNKAGAIESDPGTFQALKGAFKGLRGF